MKKRAIVTGATGFVGSNLCRKLLSQGWEVGIIADSKFGFKNIEEIKNQLTISEDISLEAIVKFFKDYKAEAVFHLASLFVAEHEINQVENLIDSNIKFGSYILEAMRNSNTKLIINTGTSWQHYHTNDYNPVCLYAATKEAFISILKYYVEAEETRAITLKLFDTYGENDRRPKLINLLNKFAKEKTELNMSEGEQMLDLVHVDDVAEAFIKAFEYLEEQKVIKYEEFGVSSGREIKLKEVIEIFENISGEKVNVNWGAKPYRKREVMELWNSFKKLPNWECKINIEEGLKKYRKD
ncbi:MAG: NAD-dependent epimerase/dehydratase family protein [Fusobacteriaceae bacterium]|nr:NAD-dependent epimerase/dehydratase family protein [Fusobacteriaceae bacterium]